MSSGSNTRSRTCTRGRCIKRHTVASLDLLLGGSGASVRVGLFAVGPESGDFEEHAEEGEDARGED
jgi:hypothetical protein